MAHTASLSDLLKTISANAYPISINGLEGGALPWTLAHIVAHIGKRPLLIVAPSDDAAETLAHNIRSLYDKMENPPAIHLFPPLDPLPYSRLQASAAVTLERMAILHHVLQPQASIVVASVRAISVALPPPALFRENSLWISMGDEIDPETLKETFPSIGYFNAPLVEEPGHFGIRGCIIDIWPPAEPLPIRIELDGERVISIRQFHPDTQRTHSPTDNIVVSPARAILLTDDLCQGALGRLKAMADHADVPLTERQSLAEMLTHRRYTPHMETLLPLFYPTKASLLDYLSSSTVVGLIQSSAIEREWDDFNAKLADLHSDSKSIERMIPPTDILVPIRPLLTCQHATFFINSVQTPANEASSLTFNTRTSRSLTATVTDADKSSILTPMVRGNDRYTIVITCHTQLQAERVMDLLRWQGLACETCDLALVHLSQRESRSILVAISDLSDGFIWESEKIAIITEAELFSRKTIHKPPPTTSDTFLNLQELADDDYIVHNQHGIGRYLGLVHLNIHGIASDFVTLEYLGGDKLYLPAYRLNLIQKYVGPGDSPPPMDKLGGARWSKAKSRIVKEIRTMAGELLKIYAARQLAKGYSFPERDHEFEEFETQFPFDETPDQWQAINDVINDMHLQRPMDRLICGDVGYGKTEVAMRAAYRAVTDGKQVAVLVPTTILAFQHYQSFLERFSKTPVRIDMLNRFRSPTEQKEITGKLAKGEIDIIIGTHRLLSLDITFRNLGLLVVDEEHRFGVRHKERIRVMKQAVDTLAMSATPIPRTLNMALSGIREISIIKTPPIDRMAIKTYVSPFDSATIRSAILRERDRGGQIFFVHNRIQSIFAMQDRLKQIVPEATSIVAHGQMNEHELESAMMKFLEKKTDILLSTSIIESGIDIPSANTIIINRADTFGLAALYQLRGRVGRSNQQAYAYMLVPDGETITPSAEKRLTALQRHTDLGSGFAIAMHDLEIRGAGNLLGHAQHGHIAEIGYELYTKLLERTIRQMRGEAELEEIDPEMKLSLSTFIPESYIPDGQARMIMYRRLSQVDDPSTITDMAQEMEDRFGPMPQEVIHLLGLIEAKGHAKRLRIEEVLFDGSMIVLTFNGSTPVTPEIILGLVRRAPNTFTLIPPNRLKVTPRLDSPSAVFSCLNDLFMELEKTA